MTKGKYAARAANREVARDNAIIVEKMAEIDRLTTELATARRQLADERRERNALILHRAEELGESQINAANEKIDDLKRAQEERDRETAEWIAKLVRWVNENATPNWLTDEQLDDEDSDVWPYVFPQASIRDGAGRVIGEEDTKVEFHVEKMWFRLVGQDIGDLGTIAYGELHPSTRWHRRQRFKDAESTVARHKKELRAIKRDVLVKQMRDVINVEEAQA